MSEERTIGSIATAVIAVVALVLAGGALIFSASAATSDSSGAPETAAAGSDVSSSAPVAVSLSEFAIDPDPLSVAVGGELAVTNDGSVEHDLQVRGADLATPMLAAGGEASLPLGELTAGTYEVFCSVPGHESGGMLSTLKVTGDGGAQTVADDGGEQDHAAHGADADWSALDAAMTESILEFPAETQGRGNQPLEPEEILDDGTKVFRLTAGIFDWEKAPGEIVEGWGYNGQVPGPEIRVDVGDRVHVIIENELPMGTDVHWHGVHVPNDQDGVAPLTQDLIEPGEEYTYEFTADEPAIGMYHPHHHGQMKLPNGMFGALIVGDAPIPYGRTIAGREIPDADELDLALEIPMILNDAGNIGLTLNGKSFPATEPIVVNEDDWVVMHYYNEGLTSHPMHLHQFPQLVFAKDGFPLDSPRWEDTVNVAPGERYSVLFKAEDVGTWVFHCHILTHAEGDDGMFGMVSALVVQ